MGEEAIVWRKIKENFFLVWLSWGLRLLTSCQVVEPEKRAYPQVIGIDWQEEEENYIVWLHMASLTEDTGQSKQSGETQSGKELYFTGSDDRRSVPLTRQPESNIWISGM